MPSRFPLQTLLDHTAHRLEASERLLRMLQRKENEALQRLEDVKAYREEYRQRLAGQARGGMSIHLLQDYQAFLGKLEAAVRHQESELEQVKGRWRQAYENWLVLRQRVRAYETLAQRHVAAEGRRTEKREQQQSDERAANRNYLEEWLANQK